MRTSAGCPRGAKENGHTRVTCRRDHPQGHIGNSGSCPNAEEKGTSHKTSTCLGKWGQGPKALHLARYLFDHTFSSRLRLYFLDGLHLESHIRTFGLSAKVSRVRKPPHASSQKGKKQNKWKWRTSLRPIRTLRSRGQRPPPNWKDRRRC